MVKKVTLLVRENNMNYEIVFSESSVIHSTEKAVLVKVLDTLYTTWVPKKLVRKRPPYQLEALIFDDMKFGLFQQRQKVYTATAKQISELFKAGWDSPEERRILKEIRNENKGNESDELFVNRGEIHHTPKAIKPIVRSVEDEFKR